MTITKERNADQLTLSLEGRLNTTTAPDLEAELTDCLSGVKTLTMDFSKLEYISSAGLRVLLAAKKAMANKGKMIVRHPNATVMEVFEVTGFTEILTIED